MTEEQVFLPHVSCFRLGVHLFALFRRSRGSFRRHLEKHVGGDGTLAIPADQGGKIVRLHEGTDLLLIGYPKIFGSVHGCFSLHVYLPDYGESIEHPCMHAGEGYYSDSQ